MWWKNRFKDWEMFLQIIEEMMNQDMFTDRKFVEDVLIDAYEFTDITRDRVDFTLTRILDGFKFTTNKFASTSFLALAKKIEDKIDYYNKNPEERIGYPYFDRIVEEGEEK